MTRCRLVETWGNGEKLIRIRLSSEALATARFVVSPLMHIRGAMSPGYPRSAEIHETLKRRKLRILSILHRECNGDGLVLPPAVSTDFHPDVDTELQQITTAPAPFVDRIVSRLRKSRNTEFHSFAELDEREFAELFASELEQVWKDCLAPHWSAMASQAEADIDHRGRAAARAGLGAVLDTLHPSIAYREDTLSVAGGCEGDVDAAERITLYPTVLNRICRADIEAWRAVGVRLSYPARALHGTDEQVTQALSEVLGHTRLTLLADLGVPRTTAELADLHHLSRSTVSYHLARLHRAGLTTRTRSGSSVYYQVSADGGRLVVGGGPPPPPKNPRDYERAHPRGL
ncbi:ArsR/SmtB family transcription factor [Streptomyces sp. NPDC059373]